MFYVYKGFGGYTDQQTYNEASLQFEYTSPLADVIGKGMRRPFKTVGLQRRYFKKSMEKVINDSIKTSVTLDFVLLKNILKRYT